MINVFLIEGPNEQSLIQGNGRPDVNTIILQCKPARKNK